MIKRITAVLLVALLGVFSGVASAEYSDVDIHQPYYTAALRLQDFGIISGYEDGSFRGANSLTRAEFARILVSAMDAEAEAKSHGMASKFYDVPQGSWAVPYISYVSANGIVAGYPDGSFGPDKSITYAEVATLLGRLLGYTEEAVGSYWPDNYMKLAENLGLTYGMNCWAGLEITRADAAVMVDRTLFSKTGKGSATAGKVMLLETMGYTSLEDVLVLANGSEDKSLLSNEIRLNNNQVYTSTVKSGLSRGDLLRYAIIDEDGELVAVKRYGEADAGDGVSGYTVSMDAVITKVDGNQVEYQLSDGTKGSYRFDNTFVLYVDYAKSSYAQGSHAIKVGTDITFYGEQNGAWTSAVVGTDDDITPVLATRSYSEDDTNFEGIGINHSNLVVYRDGKAATLSDIQRNDVVYYNPKVNIMDVYTKKVTGIYYDAQPSKAYVTEVTVGGKTYTIGEQTATKKLDASAGSFEIGDKVTLLLGKNDEVAFAVELTDFDFFDYGIVMSTGQRIAEQGANEGSTEIYAEIFMPDGSIYEYVTDKDYKEYKGKMVRLTYAGGIVRMNSVASSKVYGALDVTNRTLGGKRLLKDVKVIQRLSQADAGTVELEALNFDTLDIKEIPEANLITSISANSFGDIGILYVTGLASSYRYGLLKSLPETGENVMQYQYAIYSGASLSTYTSDALFSVKGVVGGTPVAYRVTGGKMVEMKNLYQLAGANGFQAVETGRMMIGNTVYPLSDLAEILDITDSANVKLVSMEELKGMKTASVAIYADAMLEKGGIGKLITVSRK